MVELPQQKKIELADDTDTHIVTRLQQLAADFNRQLDYARSRGLTITLDADDSLDIVSIIRRYV